jgi:hypothetical protein
MATNDRSWRAAANLKPRRAQEDRRGGLAPGASVAALASAAAERQSRFQMDTALAHGHADPSRTARLPFDATMEKVGGKSSLAGAFRYCTSLDRLALGRKNYLFAGSDESGRRAAIMYTLIETARHLVRAAQGTQH